MSNAIKVGDRVWASGLGDGRMLAIHDDYGWVLWNTHDHCTARLDSLTRIEPEPVTVMVKYPPGTRVRLRQEHDHVFMVDRVEILYRDSADNSHSWYEDSLEPCDCAKCSSE